MTDDATRAGFVAVIGAPNAGKSTLVNALVGQKVAIVSPKAQTTRARLMGIAIEGEAQILLVDTPGIFEPKRRLDRAMVAAAWTGAEDADLILLVIDAAAGVDGEVERIVASLAAAAASVVPRRSTRSTWSRKPSCLRCRRDLTRAAQPRQGVHDQRRAGRRRGRRQARARRGHAGRPLALPRGRGSDATDRMIAAELTREQIVNQLYQELPYATAVETETWEDRPDGSTVSASRSWSRATARRRSSSARAGARLKAIGAAAREEIAEHLGRPVHLFLHVKVNPRWDEDRGLYRDIGLEWAD